MKILEKATTPGGVAIQLEDWGEDYPGVIGYSIGAYPIAKSNYCFTKISEQFRLSILENKHKGYTGENVKADYEALKSGTKRIEDLAERFWNGERDRILLGM